MNMIKTARLRLTLLCTGITALILFLAAFAFLFVAESNLKNNYFLSFQEDVGQIMDDLEAQNIIRHDWLAKLEANNRNLIFLEDNGHSFLYGNIVADKNRQNLIQAVKNYYAEHFISEAAASPSLVTRNLFTYTGKNDLLALQKDQYYVAYCYFPRSQGYLTAYILRPLKPVYLQIYRQRFLFAVIVFPALLFLFVFYFFFIQKMLKPITESQEKQNRFIAAASHEFRTPLAVITSCISAMKPASPLILDGQPDFIHILENESKRMTRLINDMLFLTNQKNPGQQFDFGYYELETIVLDCYESFEPLALAQDISLQISLPEKPMPLCYCDPDKLKQLLAILLHNAMSYIASDGRILISTEAEGEHLTLRVADNGIGIPDEEKNKIFEPFFRGDRSRSKKEHFGLGLSIAQEIAAAHHSKLIVEDTSGGGSTFFLKIKMR